MTLAHRIQQLRKQKGISQEELADQVGVSRQAVSKWESEQSTPDLDKILLLSQYFGVSTDYLLQGIQPAPAPKEEKPDGRIFTIVATVLNLLGVLITCLVWRESQQEGSLIIGAVFLALGCMVFGIGMVESAPQSKPRAKRNFWTVNIWLLTFLPISLCHNLLWWGMAAPYPLQLSGINWSNVTTLLVYYLPWAVYLMVGGAVVVWQTRKR